MSKQKLKLKLGRASEQNCEFKSHSGRLFIATSKNPLALNILYISSFCYTHVITCACKVSIVVNVATDEGNGGD